ncbi:hypothetical protein [Streptomyces avermitilis]|uniref:hypothetical protein n=1 Tax=Streptomyces avermitilis TaxID=33903 RepID=UPI001F5B6019|nr:hypothetical protein [Streptomyces avermitilis]
MAYGDVVVGGDCFRRQGRIRKVCVDEVPDPLQQGLPAGVRRGGIPAEPFGDDRREQVSHIAGEQFTDLGAVRPGFGGQTRQERRRLEPVAMNWWMR